MLNVSAMIRQPIVRQTVLMSPLPSGVGRTQVLLDNPIASYSATVKQSIMQEQMPAPLESGVGSTKVMPSRSFMTTNSATIQPQYLKEQMPEPLPPAQPPKILPSSSIANTEVMPFDDVFQLEQQPPPLPNHIGEGDLPGGFVKEAVLSGMKNPLYDLARGIVQIDEVTVLFDARM